MSGLVLDAGELIAIDRGNRDMLSIMWRARQNGQPVRTNPMALAQTWRDGRRQALLAKVDDRLYTSDPGDLRKLCGAAGIKAVVVGC